MGPRIFTNRPSVVEALQWWPEDMVQAGEMMGWLGANGVNFYITDEKGLAVGNPHGMPVARPGDYIVHGVDWYPCDPSVFHAKYEAINGETNR